MTALFHNRHVACQYQGCSKPVRAEIYNNKNAFYGRYCGLHTRVKLRELNKAYEGVEPHMMPAL